MEPSNQVSAVVRHEEQPARPTKHRVLPGETLEGIADRYGLFTFELRQANDLWARALEPGETLTIPVTNPQQNPATKA
ncbi:MAG TPA: LysM peptidoglycan-binding domain-containing protein [Verrucomicrobiae bacterium]|nr:LysM peptidoglycan-binding domain-containing protein [Verrucomicrobiae bacterium]